MKALFSSTLSILTLALAALACSSETSDGNGGAADTTTSKASTATGMQCFSVPVNNQNDGSTACDSQVCPGGKYCLGAAICDPGCKSELNCPRGQYCDLAANPDVGLCRTPEASMVVPCMGTTNGTTTGGGDCVSRCVAKGVGCGAPPGEAQQGCQAICPGLTETQIVCFEAATCAEVEGVGEGMPICGIGG
jgi:hypothetical protein